MAVSDRVVAGWRVGLLTVAVNVALAAFKLAAGVVGHSFAVVADGIEGLTDVGTTLALLVALQFGDRPPDPDHPYGHRRIETEITRMLALALTAGALWVGWQSLRAFQSPRPVGDIALVAAAASIGVKEWMFRYTAGAGRRLGSRAFEASAWAHRSDALTSAATLAAVAGARLGWAWLDPAGGVAVAVIIVLGAGGLYWSMTRELVDTAPAPAVMERLRRVAASTPGVRQVLRLRARLHGRWVLADLTIRVDAGLSVGRGHQIAEEVEQVLKGAMPELADVTVHVEPDLEGPAERGPGSRPWR